MKRSRLLRRAAELFSTRFLCLYEMHTVKGVGTLNNRDVASDAGYEAGYDQTKQLAPKTYSDDSAE